MPTLLIGEAWIVIDGLSDLFDKIKRESFQAVLMSLLLYGEKARWELHKNAANKSWKLDSSCRATYLPSHTSSN